METTLTELPPIPVEFVVGHAQGKKTDAQRKPYVELIKDWAAHEGMEDEAQSTLRRLSGAMQIDAQHMPKEFYQRYRQADKAQQLIDIIREVDEVIQSGEEMWTWPYVMRVMIDENILMANVSVNRFDTIICGMIPGKGRDTVRKNGNYDIVEDRNDNYQSWPTHAMVNPLKASRREICMQIVQRFLPLLS